MDDLEKTRPIITCNHCDRTVAGEVVGDFLGLNEGYDDHAQYLLVACPKCRAPFLCIRFGTDHVDHDEYGVQEWIQWGDPEVIYPRTEVGMDPSIPKPLADSYLEACRDFSVQGYISSAMMCRRVLEGICAHFKAKGRSLYEKLSDLKTQGILDSRLYEWSDEALRALGNEAAHDVKVTISKSDAKDVLEFTKAILEYLFMFAQAFAAFKKRREEKAQVDVEQPGEEPED
jgi:hypothetical protein